MAGESPSCTSRASRHSGAAGYRGVELSPQAQSCLDGAGLAGAAGPLAVFPLPDGTWSTSSPYGIRVHPVFGTVKMHEGTDFAAADGTPLLSVFDGAVSRVSFPASGNNSVTVTSVGPSGERLSVLYMHMWPSGIFVSEGAQVRAGDPIGTVGNSDTSTGAHLQHSLSAFTLNGFQVSSGDWSASSRSRRGCIRPTRQSWCRGRSAPHPGGHRRRSSAARGRASGR